MNDFWEQPTWITVKPKLLFVYILSDTLNGSAGRWYWAQLQSGDHPTHSLEWAHGTSAMDESGNVSINGNMPDGTLTDTDPIDLDENGRITTSHDVGYVTDDGNFSIVSNTLGSDWNVLRVSLSRATAGSGNPSGSDSGGGGGGGGGCFISSME